MDKKVTMQYIADKLNVTKVTVSKAINGQPGVSSELRKKIVYEAENLGYIKKKTKKYSDIKKIGIIIPKKYFFENENFYTRIYYYLLKQCSKLQIELVLSILGSTDENNNVFPYNLGNGSIEALLLCGEVNDSYFEFITMLEIPIICVDFYKLNMNRDCVIVDNFYASYAATSYLIEKGHENIGFIGNSASTSSVIDRYFGYLKAISKNKLTARNDWHIQNKTPEGITINYNLPDEMPSAFICHCDEAAYDLNTKLQSMGIKVPEQVSIVSFDNTKFSTLSVPNITTVEINKEILAGKVLDLLFWRLNNPLKPAQKVFLETKLIERDSAKAITKMNY